MQCRTVSRCNWSKTTRTQSSLTICQILLPLAHDHCSFVPQNWLYGHLFAANCPADSCTLQRGLRTPTTFITCFIFLLPSVPTLDTNIITRPFREQTWLWIRRIIRTLQELQSIEARPIKFLVKNLILLMKHQNL